MVMSLLEVDTAVRYTRDYKENTMTSTNPLSNLSDSDILALASASHQEHILSLIADSTDNEDILLALAGNAQIPEDVLMRLAHKSEQVAMYVAGRRDISPTDLASLYNPNHHGVVSNLAENPHTPPDVLEMITVDFDNDGLIFPLVVSNPATPPHVLRDLYDNDIIPIFYFASNPSCPEDVLNEICKYVVEHDSEDIIIPTMARLAGNPSSPEWFLCQTADSDHEFVRYALARNTSVPDDIRAVLMDDSSAKVSEQAQRFSS